MAETRWVALSSLAVQRGLIGGPFGSNLGGRDYVDRGVPVIRGQNLSRGRFVDFNDCVYVTKEKAFGALKTNLSAPGDLVFTQRGTLGQLAVMPKSIHGVAVISQSQMRLRVNPDVADSMYVFYACSSSMFNDEIQTNAIVAGVPHINLGILGRLEIPLPPLDEQRRIAGVLGALDDLIDTNRSLAVESSSLAGQLWRRAFEGITTSISLSECASIVLGGTPSRNNPKYWGGDVPWLNSGEANEFRVIQPSEYITKLGLDESSTKLMPAGTTIIAITGATLGQVSRMEVAACGNQSLVGVYSTDAAVNDYLFFAILDQIDVLARSATGGAQQHVNKANVEELPVKWPSEEAIGAWHSVASPLLKATANLLFEADELTKVRDELLPLLMSGKVRVRPEDVAA